MDRIDQQQINRLIQTGTPDNLSLAYQLLCSEMDEVEALCKIVTDNNMFNIDKHNMLTSIIGATVIGGIKERGIWSVRVFYDNKGFRDHAHSTARKVKTALTKTRHIWQDKF